jgi:hypothetical protein
VSAVPAVKYALGVGGIAAVVAIVLLGWKLEPATAVFGTLIVLIFMVLLIIVAALAAQRPGAIGPLALFLAWAFLVLTVCVAVLVVSCAFFDKPKTLPCLLKNQCARSNSHSNLSSAVRTYTTPDIVFAAVLAHDVAVARRVGAPSGPPRSSSASVQHFNRGFMLWVEADAPWIYCLDDQDMTWRRYPHEALDADDIGRFQTLPSQVRSRFLATGGFRLVWLHEGLRSTMGDPLMPENPTGAAIVQKFTRGLLIRRIPWFNRATGGYIDISGQNGTYVLVQGDTSAAGAWTLEN